MYNYDCTFVFASAFSTDNHFLFRMNLGARTHTRERVRARGIGGSTQTNGREQKRKMNITTCLDLCIHTKTTASCVCTVIAHDQPNPSIRIRQQVNLCLFIFRLLKMYSIGRSALLAHERARARARFPRANAFWWPRKSIETSHESPRAHNAGGSSRHNIQLVYESCAFAYQQ